MAVCQDGSMTSVVRPFRGVSADQRRAQRRTQLLRAGLDVLGSDGIANLTMTAVCARAGLTERYFYESFQNRDALLEAVFDGMFAEMHEAVRAALEAAPPDLLSRARAAAEVLVGTLTADPRKARCFVEANGHPVTRQRRTAGIHQFADLLAEQMRQSFDIPHPDRLKLACLVIIGGAAEGMLGWLDGSVTLTQAELVDECARLCVAAAETLRAT